MSTLHPPASRGNPARNGLTAENERAIRRLLERVYSRGELHAVEELVAPDYVGGCSGTGDVYLGPQGVKAHATRLRMTFHGFTIEIDELRASEHRFEARWTARGRLERGFMGVQPTCIVDGAGVEPHGPEIEVGGVTDGTLADGRLLESTTDWNRTELEAHVEDAAGHADRAHRGPASPPAPPVGAPVD